LGPVLTFIIYKLLHVLHLKIARVGSFQSANGSERSSNATDDPTKPEQEKEGGDREPKGGRRIYSLSSP
jgi:hypothetical protein